MKKDYQGLKKEGEKLTSDFIKFNTGKLSTTKQINDSAKQISVNKNIRKNIPIQCIFNIRKHDVKAITNTELNNNSAGKRNEKIFKNHNSDKLMEEKYLRIKPLIKRSIKSFKDKVVTRTKISKKSRNKTLLLIKENVLMANRNNFTHMKCKLREVIPRHNSLKDKIKFK